MEHFGFEPAFEADGGFFVRNADGFLLALVPASAHVPLPDGFHIGFGLPDAEAVRSMHERMSGARVAVADLHTSEDYVTFRCFDPDGTEIEVFWEAG